MITTTIRLKQVNSFLLSLIVLTFLGCGQGTETGNGSGETMESEETSEAMQEKSGLKEAELGEAKTDIPAGSIVLENNGLKLVSVKSVDYPDAELHFDNVNGGVDKIDPGIVGFSFKVVYYGLGNQTPDARDKLCANSSQGQHIHLILNGGPYTAHYEPALERELEEGHYDMLAFLSRSYHESVKSSKAFTTSHFDVGKGGTCNFDASGPHMFYSRPKGNYVGDEIQNLLLDFYLLNVSISEDGYKVKATVDGTEFIITTWVPYFIQGLEMGNHTIRLELIDSEGNTVPSPYNPVEREVRLAMDEPIIEGL